MEGGSVENAGAFFDPLIPEHTKAPQSEAFVNTRQLYYNCSV
jgi:hypothetical protein